MKLPIVIFLLPVLRGTAASDLEFRSLHVVSDIRFRFAKTIVRSRIVNPSSTGQNLTFQLTLPNSAFITGLKIISDEESKVKVGRVKERESADKRYREAQKRSLTIAYIGLRNVHDTNAFEVGIFIKPGDKINVTVTYEEVLQRRQGLYDHNIYIDPGQPVPDVKIDVAIQETRDITSLDTDLGLGSEEGDAGEDVVVQRPTSKSAYIRFHPTLDQVLDRWAEGISGRFGVTYDVSRDFEAGDILVSNNFFVHFFAPSVPDPVPKDVLFILDTSTSMFSGKLQQLKTAMAAILRDLNPRDRFNIITFGSRVVFWQKKMADVQKTTNVEEAIEYMNSVKALGWTNIKLAFSKGLKYLNKHRRSSEGALIIFLTDGHATAGETQTKATLDLVRGLNTEHIPIYTLALGRDADWDLMKKLALQNYGVGKRIYTDGNVTQQIEGFYHAVAHIMLQGVNFNYPGSFDRSSSKYQTYSRGSEIIVTGRVGVMNRTTILDTWKPNVTAVSYSGIVTLNPPKVMVDLEKEFQNLESVRSSFDMEKMTERMWAYLYVLDLLKRRVGEADKTKRQKLERDALTYSLRHKLVTPMTKMIVDMPYEMQNTQLSVKEDEYWLYYHKEKVFGVPEDPYQWRRYGSGRGGGGWDPHFMVYMSGLKYPICFDVHGDDNKYYQLLHDPRADLTVNARMNVGRTNSRAYYMTEIRVHYRDLKLEVTCDNMTLQGVTYPWVKDYNGSLPGAQFSIKRLNWRMFRLSVLFDNRVEVDVKNIFSRRGSLQKLLNIEVGNEHLLSTETDGLIGQFINKKMSLEDITEKGGHLIGHIRSKTGLEVAHGKARIIKRQDPVWKTWSSCWHLKKMAADLFDQAVDYMIENLSQTSMF